MTSRAHDDSPIASKAADATLASSFVRILADYCGSHGLSAEKLFSTRGLDIGLLDEPEQRIGYLDFLRLCELAQRELNDPFLGLHLGAQMKTSYLGPYGFALMSSSSPREMLPQAARYSTLAIGVGMNVFEERGDEFIRYWRNPFGDALPSSRFLDELVMASWIAMIRNVVGSADVCSKWASFRSPEPSDRRPYEAWFRCPLTFSAPDYALGFDRRLLDVKLPQGHPEVRASINALCEQMLGKLAEAHDPPWLRDCRRSIASSLATGATDLAKVAQDLNVTPATLRQRLSRRSTSFSVVVDDVRHELASRYLKDPSLSLVDIAYLLGFSEQSAFQRAFKRRAGVTPGEFRRRGAA